MDQNIIDAPQQDLPSPARYAELAQLVAAMQPDFEKFYGQGNKAAGTRIRQAMQQLKSFAQNVRTEVQEIKNGAGTSPADPATGPTETALY